MNNKWNSNYRLLWSDTRREWVVADELSSAGGKGKSRGAMGRLVCAVLAVLGLCAATLSPVSVMAAPAGGQVTAGSGVISQSGNTTTIKQSSNHLSLAWKSFNVAPAETVNFKQPSVASIAVNRIYDTDGSRIMGHLNANGQVYLINPNGIIFGQNAQVNVGGLVASTLNIPDADIGKANQLFSGNSNASIINNGTIHASPGGYVALLGHSVTNSGIIIAKLGTVALGAGNQISLTFSGNQLLKLQVMQSTLDALAANHNLIQADGGQVYMNAGARDTLLASVVNNDGIVQAHTVQNHSGTITLLGGMAAGITKVAGTLDASAPNGGNGGFIETSAAHVKVANNAKITTLAADGQTGSWLIDPHDFTIASSASGTVTSGTSPGDISGATLSTALGLGNVSILSSQGSTVSGSGNINVNDAVSWNANLLTLTAANNININAVMSATGVASLAMNPATRNGADTAVTGGTINVKLGNGGFIGRVDFSGGGTLNIGGTSYTVINSLGAAGSTTGSDLQGMGGSLAGHYVLGSNIGASTTSTWNTNTGFMPIGNSTADFTGIFDGLGHTITGLTINRSNTDYQGLFGSTAYNSTLRNVGLVGGSVSGKRYVGGLAGLSSSIISNAYATGAVSGFNSVGGLVGYDDYGSISNAYATGAVTSLFPLHTFYVGGLVGHDRFASISNSFWDTTTTNQASSAGGASATGMSTTAMQTQANFTGWDFTGIWVMHDTYTYPLLRALMTPLTFSASKTYDATTTVGTVTYLSNGQVTSKPTDVSGTASFSISSKDAGTQTLHVSGLYSTTQQGHVIDPGTMTITKAPLTATMTALNKTYDATKTAAPTFTITNGLVGAETVTASGAATFVDKNAGVGKTVTANTVSLTNGINGGLASNYSLAAGETALATITKANLSVTGLSASNKVYDTLLTDTLSGTAAVTALGTDSVTLGGTAAGTFATKNVGTAKAVTVTGVTLSGSGTDNSNYTLTQQSGLTANITKANLSVTGLTAGSKVYDANTTAMLGGTAAVTALLGDSVSVNRTGESGAFTNKNVANGIAVSVNGDALSGADAGNYNLIQQSGLMANITPAGISGVTGIGAGNKVYDATSSATLNTSGVGFAGMLSGDALTLGGTATGAFSDKNVANGITVNITGITLGGTDASNYNLTTATASTTANITKALLTYVATPVSILRNQRLPASFSGTVGGLMGREPLATATSGTLTWSTPVSSSATLGSFAIHGRGLTAANYLFSQEASNATALTIQSGRPPQTVMNLLTSITPNFGGGGRFGGNDASNGGSGSDGKGASNGGEFGFGQSSSPELGSRVFTFGKGNTLTVKDGGVAE